VHAPRGEEAFYLHRAWLPPSLGAEARGLPIVVAKSADALSVNDGRT
jgi:hypothetical protein